MDETREPAQPRPQVGDEKTDLYRRHCSLARRLLRTGDRVGALDVCLGLLDWFAPVTTSPPMRLLVEDVLRELLGVAEAKTAESDLLARLSSSPELRAKCQWAVARYLQDDGLDGDSRLLAERVQAALADLDGRPAATAPAIRRATPGVVRGVYVPSRAGGRAECRRLYVSVDPTAPPAAEPVGTSCPGLGLQAGRSYLQAAGVGVPAEGAVELLVEGGFGLVEGESFSLPVAVALISAELETPVPDDFAFTGALRLRGGPQPDGHDIFVLPVSALPAKCEAAQAAGCTRIYLPEQGEPDDDMRTTLAKGGCEVVPVAHLGQVLRDLFPEHAAAASLELATFRDMLRALSARGPASARALPLVSALVMGAIVFERGFVGEYLVRPEYGSPGAALAASGAAAVLVGVATFRLVSLPERLPEERPLPRWGVASLALAAAFAAAWGAFHVFLPPLRALPPAPHDRVWEHPSFQTFKDLSADAFFAGLFVLSPAYLVQAMERLQKAGRRRWARELAGGRLARAVSGPIPNPTTLAIVGACAIAALLPADIRSALPGSGRYGADRPWHAIHVELKDLTLSVAAAAFVAWFAGRTSPRRQPPVAARRQPLPGQPSRQDRT